MSYHGPHCESTPSGGVLQRWQWTTPPMKAQWKLGSTGADVTKVLERYVDYGCAAYVVGRPDYENAAVAPGIDVLLSRGCGLVQSNPERARRRLWHSVN